MNNVKYYRTSNPEVLTAYKEMIDAAKNMRAELEKACGAFNAEPVIRPSLGPHSFWGMRLKNYCSRKDTHLWTKPDSKAGFSSRPRSRVTGYSKEFKDVKLKFTEATKSIGSVSKEPFYRSIGGNWGDFLFYGLAVTECEGVLFLKTAAELQNCIEITGTEYLASKSSL